jgi:hypothetical protein
MTYPNEPDDWFLRDFCRDCTDRAGHTRPRCDEPCEEAETAWAAYNTTEEK